MVVFLLSLRAAFRFFYMREPMLIDNQSVCMGVHLTFDVSSTRLFHLFLFFAFVGFVFLLRMVD